MTSQSLMRLPKAQLVELLEYVTGVEGIALDNHVEPKAPAKKAKKVRSVKCAIHTAKQCNRKFWSTKGANEHVAKRTS